jgi:16S rRNA (guanine966-N2)-methyltransferase
VRVIGGSSRGRRLRAPAGSDTRPTADRVREAVFDMLDTLVDLEDLAVVDLFAGSGAMGIEALSRGAGSVVFVERAPAALTAIKANLVSTGLDTARARPTRAEAMAFLARPHHFDVALVDPPYAFGHWEELLARLDAELAVLESDRELAVPPSWEVLRHKRYGDTLVTVVRHADAPAEGQKGSP